MGSSSERGHLARWKEKLRALAYPNSLARAMPSLLSSSLVVRVLQLALIGNNANAALGRVVCTNLTRGGLHFAIVDPLVLMLMDLPKSPSSQDRQLTAPCGSLSIDCHRQALRRPPATTGFSLKSHPRFPPLGDRSRTRFLLRVCYARQWFPLARQRFPSQSRDQGRRR